jgi:CheY-like chemotaxis protein
MVPDPKTAVTSWQNKPGHVKSKQTTTRMFTILLVDDSLTATALIRHALKQCGFVHQLFMASDGLEGLAFLRREGRFRDAPRPDMILLDLHMPSLGGLETLEILKEDDDLKTVPVVVMTASDDWRDVQSAYERHANAYLVKPKSLREAVEQMRAIGDFWLAKATLSTQVDPPEHKVSAIAS